MAISVVSSASVTMDAGIVYITFSSWTPATDDLIVLFLGSSNTSTLFTDPSGWVNPLGSQVDVETDSHQACAFYHFVTSGEASAVTTSYGNASTRTFYEFSEFGSVNGIVLRGVDTTTPIDSINSTFNSANSVTPHVLASLTGTNLSSNSMVVSRVNIDGTGTWTQPTGWTTRTSINTNQGSNLLTRDTLTTASTDVTATNITPSAGDEYISITIAFTEAAAGGAFSGTGVAVTGTATITGAGVRSARGRGVNRAPIIRSSLY